MVKLSVITKIAARPEVCFDLARSVDAHLASTLTTGERVVGGKTCGLLGLGDEVTWEARHLGVRQCLSIRITAFQRPVHFQDRMTRGAFRMMVHDHHFQPFEGGTIMRDDFAFAAPFGPLGWLVERLVLAGHLRRFLTRRGVAIKSMAEQAPCGQ